MVPGNSWLWSHVLVNDIETLAGDPPQARLRARRDFKIDPTSLQPESLRQRNFHHRWIAIHSGARAESAAVVRAAFLAQHRHTHGHGLIDHVDGQRPGPERRRRARKISVQRHERRRRTSPCGTLPQLTQSDAVRTTPIHGNSGTSSSVPASSATNPMTFARFALEQVSERRAARSATTPGAKVERAQPHQRHQPAAVRAATKCSCRSRSRHQHRPAPADASGARPRPRSIAARKC